MIAQDLQHHRHLAHAPLEADRHKALRLHGELHQQRLKHLAPLRLAILSNGAPGMPGAAGEPG